MATSGTYTFTMDNLDIIEEAFDLAGIESRTSKDLDRAIRSLELLLLEWSNDQVNLWTVDQQTVNLTSGTVSYTLDDETIDVLSAVARDTTNGNNDVPSNRISIEEYLDKPDKDIAGIPTHFSVLRGRTASTLYVWPVPDNGNWQLVFMQFVYWRMRYLQDAGGYTDNPEVPDRFLPALVAGLAWKISQKYPARYILNQATGQPVEVDGVTKQHRDELAMEYGKLYQAAKYEDRDRASLYALPRMRR